MFKSNTSMKIISLLAALVLWLYVMGEVDPELRGKITDIPVKIVNTEELSYKGLAPVYEETVYISATISGKRSDVNDIKKSGLIATVDVADCDKGENELKINVNLPNEVSLEDISQSTMNIEVEDLVRAYKEVKIKFSQIDATAEMVPIVLEYYPTGVNISGPESSMNKIKEVRGLIGADKATGKSEWVTVKLVPVNKKGKEIQGITLTQEMADAKIQKLPVKAVNLKVTLSDEITETEAAEIPERIRIVGDKELIEGIEVIEAEVKADKNGKLIIKTELPQNVYLVIGEDNGKIIWN